MIKSKIANRIISLLLSLAMLFSITAGLDFSTFANTDKGYEYGFLSDGTVEITGYTGSESDLTIPSTYDDCIVTSIREWAFYGCNSITSVTIPNSVTNIGNLAFFNCSSLKSVSIGDGVTNIGDSAFDGCENLTSVTIGNSVTNIGDDAFYGCSSLTSITIPNSVTNIGNSAFNVCYDLTSITVDSGNKNYSSQDGVLFNKNKTTLIQYPAGNTRTSYTIPSSVTNIGDSAFYECDRLKSVTIGNSVTDIGEFAFEFCNSLTSITIPNSVTSIGDWAFHDCINLTIVTIPNSVTSIGDLAFDGCNSLISITVDSSNKNYSSQDGVLFNKNKTILIQYPAGNTRTSYTIPNSVTSIGAVAFYECRNLTSVTIPNSVTSIGNRAFGFCESLISITIPVSVTSIGIHAFECCKNLTSIVIMNPNCEIQDIAAGADYTIPSSATIYGYKNSTADIYARTYNHKFIALNGEHKHTYKTTTTKATTKKNGSIVTKCSVCGNVSKKTTIYYPKTIILSTTSYTYNGKVKKPSVAVKDSKGKKLSSSNYTVSYSSGRKNVGQYTVTIKFKGNYSGTVKKTFTIKPKATTLSKVTAGKKAFTVKWKKQATQTTGYQIQYSTSSKFKGAKIVTVSKNKTTSKKISKLKAKKKYYVHVRTYKTVKVNGKNTKIYSSWSKVKTVKTK